MQQDRYYRRADSYGVGDLIKIKMSRNVRSFALEVGQNCKRVAGLFTSFWILCSYYLCLIQCGIQGYLSSLTQYLEFCEADIVYDASSYFNPFSKATSKKESTPLEKPSHSCICGEEANGNELAPSYYTPSVSRWLRRIGFPASLGESSRWNDGTLMWQILRRVDKKRWSGHLIQGKKKENWSLIGAQIKRFYPGLVKNQLILFCLVASNEVSMHHIIYILNRIMNQYKRSWRAIILRQVIRTADGLGSILQPRFTVNGPGISHANINLRNEFKVETCFSCPSFTVEIHDDSGDIWRENTRNARIIVHRGEEYHEATDLPHSERPIEIVKVSRMLYKVFYIVRSKGICKIIVRPGIGKGGHVYGSPFIVQADGAAIARNPQRERHRTIKDSLCVKSVSTVFDEEKRTPLKRIEDLDVASLKQVEKRRWTVLKPPSFRDILQKSMESIAKRFGRSPPHQAIGKSEQKPKRKTIINPSSGWPGMHRMPSSAKSFLPASRRLRIRSVTVHRYTNEAMPSIEKYFFDVDENGNVPPDAGKHRGIMRLMRQSFSTSLDNTDSEGAQRSHPTTNSTGRRPRLRREKNVFASPWRKYKRHSDTKCWIDRPSRWRESSSSSESDLFETGSINVSKKKDMKRTQSAETFYSRGKGGQSFRNAIRSDGSVADILLNQASPGNKASRTRKVAETRGNETNAKGAKPKPRNRRSGYEIVKQQSSITLECIPETFKQFVDSKVAVIMNTALQAVRRKRAISLTDGIDPPNLSVRM